MVLAEALVGDAAVDGVDECLFVQGEADAPDDAAVKLVGAGLFVEEGADVVGGNYTADFDHVGVGVDGDLGEDCAPGLGAEIGVAGGLGVGGDLNGLAAGAADDVDEAVGLGG